MSIINATGGGSMGGNVNIVQFGDMTPEQFAAACAGSGASSAVADRTLEERMADATPTTLNCNYQLGEHVEYDNKEWVITHVDRERGLVYLQYNDILDYISEGIQSPSFDYTKTNACKLIANFTSNEMSSSALEHCVPMPVQNAEYRVYIPSVPQLSQMDWYNKRGHDNYPFSVGTSAGSFNFPIFELPWYSRPSQGISAAARILTTSAWSSVYTSGQASMTAAGYTYINGYGIFSNYNSQYLYSSNTTAIPFICIKDSNAIGTSQSPGSIHCADYSGSMVVGNKIRLDGDEWTVFMLSGDYALLALNDAWRYYMGAYSSPTSVGSAYQLSSQYIQSPTTEYAPTLSYKVRERCTLPEMTYRYNSGNTTYTDPSNYSKHSLAFNLPAYQFYAWGLNSLSADILKFPYKIKSNLIYDIDDADHVKYGYYMLSGYADSSQIGSGSNSVIITADGEITTTSPSSSTYIGTSRPFIYYKYRNV